MSYVWATTDGFLAVTYVGGDVVFGISNANLTRPSVPTVIVPVNDWPLKVTVSPATNVLTVLTLTYTVLPSTLTIVPSALEVTPTRVWLLLITSAPWRPDAVNENTGKKVTTWFLLP